MLNYAHQFIKIKLVFHTPYLISETKPVTPNFYFTFETSKSLSVCSRSLKIYRLENFRANVLKAVKPGTSNDDRKTSPMHADLIWWKYFKGERLFKILNFLLWGILITNKRSFHWTILLGLIIMIAHHADENTLVNFIASSVAIGDRRSLKLLNW